MNASILFKKGFLFAAFVALATTQTSASAGVLLDVDLSSVNQITITATSGTSAATVSGGNFTGFYLDNFFSSDPGDNDLAIINVGSLTSALNASDGSPRIWNGFEFDDGLNIYSYTTDTISDFIIDTLAFIGTATWAVSSTAYAAALSGATSGDIYFPADTADDVANATLLGSWARASVPEPTTLALFGLALAGLGFSRRRLN